MIINGFVDVIGPPPLRGQPRFILHSRNEVHTKKTPLCRPPPISCPPRASIFLIALDLFFKGGSKEAEDKADEKGCAGERERERENETVTGHQIDRPQ